MLKIITPTLLLNPQVVRRNISKMAEKAGRTGVEFRPHFKTHQSAQIGEWFREAGVDKITVSSMEMADYFAQHGWRDITVAFPVNIREIEPINQLAQKIKLNLLVESLEAVQFLENNLQSPVEAWIKIDVGLFRTGVLWSNHKILKELADAIRQAKKLKLAGLLTHAGHTYSAKSTETVRNIFKETTERMQACADLLARFGNQEMKISVGDTPGCSLVEIFSGVDEVRPGNFVFYDVMQLRLGSCTEQQIAVAVACPVVAKHAERLEIVIYGGAIHLSKNSLTNQDGSTIFGLVAEWLGNGWSSSLPGIYVSSISQEHGIVKTNKMFFDKIKLGDLLVVLPVHSCLTVTLMKKCLTLDGEIITTMNCE